MGTIVSTLKQIFDTKKVTTYFLLAGIPAMLFYSISLYLLTWQGYSITELLRDPAQQSGASTLLGFLSTMGIWLWISSTAICFFCLLNRNFIIDNVGKELLILIALASLILGIDDFFMIHDRYVPEIICYGVYAVGALLLLARHHKKIMKIDGFSFILTGTLLGLSILTDLIQAVVPYTYEQTQVVEEGFKFMGAATWLYFSSRVVSYQLLSALRT